MGQIIYNGRNYSGLIQPNGVFIDPNTVIDNGNHSPSNPLSYTATQDCFFYSAVALTANTGGTVRINGEPVGSWWNGSGTNTYNFGYFLKKGQTLTATQTFSGATDYIVYGIQSGSNIATSINYSTSEQVIGTWIDGSTLYEKTIDCGALPNNTTKNVAHGISDMDYAVVISGSAKNPNNGIRIPLPYVYGNTRCLQTYIDATNIKLISTENMSGYTQSYVTIQYTKTS